MFHLSCRFAIGALIFMALSVLLGSYALTSPSARPMESTVINWSDTSPTGSDKMTAYPKEQGWQVDSTTASMGQLLVVVKRYETPDESLGRWLAIWQAEGIVCVVLILAMAVAEFFAFGDMRSKPFTHRGGSASGNAVLAAKVPMGSRP